MTAVGIAIALNTLFPNERQLFFKPLRQIVRVLVGIEFEHMGHHGSIVGLLGKKIGPQTLHDVHLRGRVTMVATFFSRSRVWQTIQPLSS